MGRPVPVSQRQRATSHVGGSSKSTRKRRMFRLFVALEKVSCVCSMTFWSGPHNWPATVQNPQIELDMRGVATIS